MDESFQASRDPLERLLQLPSAEIRYVTDALADAWRMADHGEVAAGYTLLLAGAARAKADCPLASWQPRLTGLWVRVLDQYCSLYGVMC